MGGRGWGERGQGDVSEQEEEREEREQQEKRSGQWERHGEDGNKATHWLKDLEKELSDRTQKHGKRGGGEDQ